MCQSFPLWLRTLFAIGAYLVCRANFRTPHKSRLEQRLVLFLVKERFQVEAKNQRRYYDLQERVRYGVTRPTRGAVRATTFAKDSPICGQFVLADVRPVGPASGYECGVAEWRHCGALKALSILRDPD